MREFTSSIIWSCYVIFRYDDGISKFAEKKSKVCQVRISVIRGSICRQRRCYGKRDADAPFSLFHGLESDWNVRTSLRPALLSFVVGKFRSFHDQAAAEETSRREWGRKETTCSRVYTMYTRAASWRLHFARNVADVLEY